MFLWKKKQNKYIEINNKIDSIFSGLQLIWIIFKIDDEFHIFHKFHVKLYVVIDENVKLNIRENMILTNYIKISKI